jgi:8-oxo-dGTP pyrophosphatase MutT (NUDIX family)
LVQFVETGGRRSHLGPVDSRGDTVSVGPREVARGLLFDGQGQLLMVHWRNPVTGHEFLEPPGGLREGSETFESAVRREIAEETGLEEVEVGELVTEIDHHFTFGGQDYDCRERYFVCRLTGDGARPTSLDLVENAGIIGAEWVSVDELFERPSDQIEPPELLEILRQIGRIGEAEWRRRKQVSGGE